ncbi:peptidylprolyl isomerase [Saccharothrix yanglingensis]|uniref:PPIase cyclophilin-type domain-containing protein n=1 Tax=Saccharothrix yanglingensis TaxID=659496 RepID=A0ABU0WWQ4_9PSEU|nr:peptidylprolyl isomerase [Saccharothrix yanglingensis]MDQ2584296.1 hypothetical protein [Saccharothrix yanglingensis]
MRGQPPAGKATPPSPDAEATGAVRLTVGTDGGELELELDAASAPCPVHSFRSLADQGFFDGTSCHRLTTVGLFVLQCGDATGTGQGTPGYAFDDPAAVPGEYRRGVVAMANASAPGTNGSQFFIVHRTANSPRSTRSWAGWRRAWTWWTSWPRRVSCRAAGWARGAAGPCGR